MRLIFNINFPKRYRLVIKNSILGASLVILGGIGLTVMSAKSHAGRVVLEGIAFPDKETSFQVSDLLLIQIPKASFEKSQKFSILKTQDQETADDFDTSTSIYSAVVERAPFEVRINTGNKAPKKALNVEFVVPEDLAKRFTSPGSVSAFVQFFYDGDEETLDHFESVASKYDPIKKKLALFLEPKSFSNLRNKEGSFEAIVIIAGIKSGKLKSK